jgi:hypothetical protein
MVSIPDELIGSFNLLNPSSSTVALGLTHPLTYISTRIFSCGKVRPAGKADSLCAISEPLSAKYGILDVP